jgi:hypothetical protein
MPTAEIIPDDSFDDEAGKGASYTFGDWLSYKIDSVVSKQSGQVKGLAIISIVFVLVAGALEMEIAGVSFDVGVWEAWNYMADPGTHGDCVNCVEYIKDGESYDEAGDGDGFAKKINWGARVLAVGIAWGGILFFAVVIGFIIDAIQEKMESLKKGKSNVVEEGHTVMLGWNQLSIDFIREICDANDSDGGGVIVVLADRDKQELERSFKIQMKRKELMGTKVVFRKGQVTNQADLKKVAAHTARAILILSDGELSADMSDSQVVRAILSLHGLPCKLSGYVVAEICDVDNEPLAHMVGGACLETVVSHDLIGRLMLMSARQPGLSKVYNEVLGFSGDEFYMKSWPEAAGKKFSQLAPHFPMAIPLGVQCADGSILLNPGDSHTMAHDDEVIVLAEDDDTYKFEKSPQNVVVGTLPPNVPEVRKAETILMAGWRRDIRDVLQLLDSMVVQGSEVHMLAEVPVSERKNRLLAGGLDPDALENITLVHYCGRTASRKVLQTLPVQKYTSVMILSDEACEDDVMSSDSNTLATLLLLRNIQEELMNSKKGGMIKPVRRASSVMRAEGIAAICPCISEILDSRTQKTVQANKEVRSASDFVESNKMISQILSMVVENRGVKKILGEFLSPDGSELIVNDSLIYVQPGEAISFLTLTMRAQQRGEICCGYQDVSSTVINPRDKFEIRTWGGCDIVVLGVANPTTSATSTSTTRRPSKGGKLTSSVELAAASKMTKRKHKSYNLETVR